MVMGLTGEWGIVSVSNPPLKEEYDYIYLFACAMKLVALTPLRPTPCHRCLEVRRQALCDKLLHREIGPRFEHTRAIDSETPALAIIPKAYQRKRAPESAYRSAPYNI